MRGEAAVSAEAAELLATILAEIRVGSKRNPTRWAVGNAPVNPS